MERIMAVLTPEIRYAEKLCDFVNRKNVLRLFALPFDSPENLCEYSAAHRVEMLVADVDFSRSLRPGSSVAAEDIDAARRVYLSSARPFGESFAGSGSTPVLRKYQSAEELVGHIAAFAEDLRVRKNYPAGEGARVTGIYSPVSRCGQTSFALTLTKESSRRQRTLYLNLEEFTPFISLLGAAAGEGISEAVYLMKQGKLDGEKLRQLICRGSGVEWLPPVSDPDDLRAIGGEDYISLIRLILRETDYEHIIIDMNRYAGQADVLTDICTKVYLPCSEDRISVLKRDAFLDYIRKQKGPEWAEKIVCVELPAAPCDSVGSRATYLDSIYYGDMGARVRDLLRDTETEASDEQYRGQTV